MEDRIQQLELEVENLKRIVDILVSDINPHKNTVICETTPSLSTTLPETPDSSKTATTTHKSEKLGTVYAIPKHSWCTAPVSSQSSAIPKDTLMTSDAFDKMFEENTKGRDYTVSEETPCVESLDRVRNIKSLLG